MQASAGAVAENRICGQHFAAVLADVRLERDPRPGAMRTVCANFPDQASIYSFPFERNRTVSAFVDCINDPGLPTLPAVLNPLELGEHLRESLPSQTKGLKEIQVRLLRHHVGKRCVVEITLRATEGSFSCLASAGTGESVLPLR